MIDYEQKIPQKISHYQFSDVLGSGAYSIVKLAVDCNDPEKKYACKIIPKERINNPRQMECFENEIRILQQMRHPNIVQLFDLIKDNSFFYVFLEYCPNGDMFKNIVSQKFLSECDAKIYFREFIEALKYIHSIGAAHRDLKPENLLVTEKNQIKISDFGFSKFVWDQKEVTTCGSLAYISPEIVLETPHNSRKSDLWSAGVILYAMVTGQIPWSKKGEKDIYEQIEKCEYKIPEYLSKDCRDLISKLLVFNPDERLNCSEILVHPWVNGPQNYIEDRSHICPISLQTIDIYFNRNFSEIKSFHSSELQLNISAEFDSIKKVKKYLEMDREEGLPALSPLGRMVQKIPSALEMMKRNKIRRCEQNNRRTIDLKQNPIVVTPKLMRRDGHRSSVKSKSVSLQSFHH